MFWIKKLISLLVFILFVHGNTESFVIHIPKHFPIIHPTVKPQLPSIFLGEKNYITKNFAVPLNTTYYIQLNDFQVNEDYFVKICWPASTPVSISLMDYLIVPHSTSFQNTIDFENPRVFIKFDLFQDSYPDIILDSIPINISVVNMKLGIPVDLYSIIIYILVIMVGVFLINDRFDLYQLLKNSI